ncbi:hypothetical protein B0H14DRAFT_2654960 [Mycena olivaceomarginata]|nr:hypothetical protein B0H14DRAFT_2654960 [Mycena olivaceomarginata]
MSARKNMSASTVSTKMECIGDKLPEEKIEISECCYNRPIALQDPLLFRLGMLSGRLGYDSPHGGCCSKLKLRGNPVEVAFMNKTFGAEVICQHCATRSKRQKAVGVRVWVRQFGLKAVCDKQPDENKGQAHTSNLAHVFAVFSADTTLHAYGNQTNIDYATLFDDYLEILPIGLRNNSRSTLDIFKKWDRVIFPNVESGYSGNSRTGPADGGNKCTLDALRDEQRAAMDENERVD